MRKNRLKQNQYSGAMADIAFLLLIFFMVVTTFNKDYTLSMSLPAYVPNPKSSHIDKDRLLTISINGVNELMIQSNLNIEDPSSEIFSALNSIIDKNKKPIILINIHPDSDYQSYISILSDVKNAKNKLKHELSQSLYMQDYNELDNSKKELIQSKINIRISEKEMTLI